MMKMPSEKGILVFIIASPSFQQVTANIHQRIILSDVFLPRPV